MQTAGSSPVKHYKSNDRHRIGSLGRRMPVIAMRDTQIHVNDRICQFRIMKNQPEILFEEVEHLEGKDRGGFGTTGKQ